MHTQTDRQTHTHSHMHTLSSTKRKVSEPGLVDDFARQVDANRVNINMAAQDIKTCKYLQNHYMYTPLGQLICEACMQIW